MKLASPSVVQTGLEDRAFTSEGSELPLLYVFLALASVELLVVHFLVSLASPAAAWILSGLTALAIVQILMIVRRIKARPTLATADHLIVRSAKGHQFVLPWKQVELVEKVGFGPEPKGFDVLRASLLSHPNVLVTIQKPVRSRRFGRERSVRKIALRLDDPDTFLAVARRLAG